MKYRMSVMFLIVWSGMISIAAVNPIVGPLSRNLGLTAVESGCLVSVTGLSWLLGGYYWGKKDILEPEDPVSQPYDCLFAYPCTICMACRLCGFKSASCFCPVLDFLLLRAVAGFFFGGIPAKAQAYVMGWTTEETRTRGMALFGAANGLGFVFGPAMSGSMAKIGLTAPLYVAAAFILIMTTIFWLTIAEEKVTTIRQQVSSLSPNDRRILLYFIFETDEAHSRRTNGFLTNHPSSDNSEEIVLS